MVKKAPRFAPLRLKRGEERRIKAGHLWVFSNEVNTRSTPLRKFEAGQLVEIRSSRNEFLGTGYVNPGTLITARILSRDPQRTPDLALLVKRLERALALRSRLYRAPFYRLVFGESDGLPGLIVDRYADILVAQIGTAGMEAFKSDIVAALREVVRPAGILWKNDTGSRALEGLPAYVEVAHGTVPEQVELAEGAARFRVPVRTGQKTGWFFDQARNRLLLRNYAPRQRVLDVFCYLGAWGIQAALAGASEVVCVDSSGAALAGARSNAAINGIRLETVRADVFDTLEELGQGGRQFDLVILDPPAFMKRRKDRHAGRAAYQRLNRLALSLLPDQGILISCSCSHHLTEERFLAVLQRAARQCGRQLQVLERGFQARDHPVHPAIRETAYLKTLVCRVLDD